MNRRALLSLGLGGIACGRKPARTLPGCGAVYLCYDIADPLPASATDVRLRKGRRPRQLWSQLTLGEQRRIQDAYMRLMLKPKSDKRSMLYQGWLHMQMCGGDPAPQAPGEPSCNMGTTDVDVHGSYQFLPWHRAFLYMHERILQAELGDQDFRLPVWDWENDPAVPPFCGSIPDPPLAACHTNRAGYVPAFAPSYVQRWLTSGSFQEFIGCASGSGCAASGPHSDVHALLGGYMQFPTTAAVDPVFYAHHTNVDRFYDYWWQFYVASGKFKQDWPPGSERSWFVFPDENGQLVRVHFNDLLSTDTLGYCYDSKPNVPIGDFKGVCAVIDSSGVPGIRFDMGAIKVLDPQLKSAQGMNTAPGGLTLPVYAMANNPGGLEAGAAYLVGIKDSSGFLIPQGQFSLFATKQHLQSMKDMPLCVSIVLTAPVLRVLLDVSRTGSEPWYFWKRELGIGMPPYPVPRSYQSLTFTKFEVRIPA